MIYSLYNTFESSIQANNTGLTAPKCSRPRGFASRPVFIQVKFSHPIVFCSLLSARNNPCRLSCAYRRQLTVMLAGDRRFPPEEQVENYGQSNQPDKAVFAQAVDQCGEIGDNSPKEANCRAKQNLRRDCNRNKQQ